MKSSLSRPTLFVVLHFSWFGVFYFELFVLFNRARQPLIDNIQQSLKFINIAGFCFSIAIRLFKKSKFVLK